LNSGQLLLKSFEFWPITLEIDGNQAE